MNLDIQHLKIELIQWLTTLEDRTLIQKLIDLKNKDSEDGQDEISEDEKKSIEKGILDADNGKLKPNSDAVKIYGKWL